MAIIEHTNIALILIDVINDFQFDDGEQLLAHALPAAKNIANLKERAKMYNIPFIYVNDNFKNWDLDFVDLVEQCLRQEERDKPFVKLLKPNKGDYHILKPSYSGFYATPLQLLLNDLNIDTLIITGVAGDMCVQFTANDAFMRGFNLYIPKDCIASKTDAANDIALKQMKEILKADITVGDQVVLHHYIQKT